MGTAMDKARRIVRIPFVIFCILQSRLPMAAQICTDPQDERCPHFTRRIPIASDQVLMKASFHPRTTPDGSILVLATASDLVGLGSTANVQVYALSRSDFDGGVLGIELVSRKSGAALEFPFLRRRRTFWVSRC